MAQKKTFQTVSIALVFLAGINYGLKGAFQFDLLARIMAGDNTFLARILYCMIGLATVYMFVTTFALARK